MPTTTDMRISISVIATCRPSPPKAAHSPASAARHTMSPSGVQPRRRSLNDPGTSDTFDHSFRADQPRGLYDKDEDDDGESEGVAKRAKVGGQVGLQHDHDEADRKTADHRAEQAAHAADDGGDEGEQSDRLAH